MHLCNIGICLYGGQHEKHTARTDSSFSVLSLGVPWKSIPMAVVEEYDRGKDTKL